jgi:hypothetical protein
MQPRKKIREKKIKNDGDNGGGVDDDADADADADDVDVDDDDAALLGHTAHANGDNESRVSAPIARLLNTIIRPCLRPIQLL